MPDHLDYLLRDYEQCNIEIRHRQTMIYWLSTLEMIIYSGPYYVISNWKLAPWADPAISMSLFKTYDIQGLLIFGVAALGLLLNHSIFGLNHGIVRYCKQLNSIRSFFVKNAAGFDNYLWTDTQHSRTWTYRTFRVLLLVGLIGIDAALFSLSIVLLSREVWNPACLLELFVCLTVAIIAIQISVYKIWSDRIDRKLIPIDN